MKTYTIGVERQTFTTITVPADSREEAERLALVMARAGAGDFDLQHDEYVIVELADEETA